MDKPPTVDIAPPDDIAVIFLKKLQRIRDVLDMDKPDAELLDDILEIVSGSRN
jgi:hypothetical protein